MKYLFYLMFLLLFLNCAKNTDKQYLLNQVKKEYTGIAFKNEIKDDSKYNIINYLYYYNGGGVAIGDINNDNLPDLYFVSNRGDNKLYLNKGDLKFEDITDRAMVSGNSDWNTGVTMIDINSDGFLDIYVCSVSGLLNFKGHNELFINNGDNTFSEKSSEYGLDYKGYSTQAYFFDYDKDDDLDAYIVNHAVHTKNSHGPAQIRKKRSSLVGDVLLKNENNKFNNVSEKANIYGGANGYGLSASIADFDNDGWDDIYVSNDFHEDDYYYINNHDGTFKENLANSFSQTSRFSMGSDVADINADGYQDLITLDMLPYDERILKESDGDVSYNVQDFLIKQGYHKQYARNMLQLNNPKENYFTEAGLYNGVANTDWSWGPLIADFNQDGHQDLFISNGIYKRPNNLDFMKYLASSFKNKSSYLNKDQWLLNSLKKMPEGKVPNQIFKGNSKKFQNKSGSWIHNLPSLSNGAVYGDLDNDGDLDLVLNNLNDYAHIYKNNTNSNKNYLKIKFNYKKNNVNGLGTKAIVYSKKRKQLKQLFPSRGFISSVESKLHFGLDTENSIDSLIIIWPNNSFQRIISPEINKEIIVNYNKSNFFYNNQKKHSYSKKLFTKISPIDFAHNEDNYNDFNYEKLIPYKVSTAGPALAVGDVDGNGYQDIFIGNSSGKKALFYMNNGNSFTKKTNQGIKKDSLFEDIDATLFDADGDKDLDLYVSTGINESRNSTFELDRFYINDGNGNFHKTKSIIPSNYLNTSCVKSYDYDNDGDIDLFIGNRSNPNDFGQTVESYILDNDGKGNFTKNNSFKLNTKVTDAVWKDVNNDQIKDLLISTEWDTPKIFINNSGQFKEEILTKKLSGLWQTISSYDIDNDGDQDIILGNWGLNTKFQPNQNNPLVMYHFDFDNNGKNETILAYSIDNKLYPINSKDELASQMKIINKRFVKYKDYAFQSVEKVLTEQVLKKANVFRVHTLASGYLINNNGKFEEFIKFPDSFQLSPITSFISDDFTNNKLNNLLIAGNFHDLNTYHGSFSSLNGFLIEKNSTINYTSAIDLGLELHKNQIRSMSLIKMKNSKLLLTLSNNDSLQVYRYK